MNVLTTGLPYANGALHIGHIYEWILADTLVRLSRRTPFPSTWVTGDDAHGVAVANAARLANTPPKQWVDQLTQKRIGDIQSLNVLDGHYLSTSQSFHHEFVQNAYVRLKEKGFITPVLCKQYFSEVAIFERDVIGECPSCHTQQYLGFCEECQRSLEAGDLLNPRDAKTHEPVSLQDVELDHFKWGEFRPLIRNWINQNSQDNLKAKLLFDLEKLPDLWCIERCGGYFGVAIPGKTSHFYVWFDALLGYYSFSQHAGLEVDQPLTHILGKDILAFHALRLPALCAALDLPLPNPLIVHGHIVGEDRSKFSKTLGNAPSLEQVRQNWGDDVLRYYLLRNTRGTVDDISLFPGSLNQCKSQLANTLGNTFRRLHKIGEHHPLQPLQGQWKQKIQEWDDKLEEVLVTGNTAVYLEQSEHIIQLLQYAIQQGKWWEASQQEQAQQGYALICAILERLASVLPDHLDKVYTKLRQGLPLDVDDVFFEK